MDGTWGGGGGGDPGSGPAPANYYVYDSDGTPQRPASLDEWCGFMCKVEHTSLGRDAVRGADGEVYVVSTIFVGVDTSLGYLDPPQVFETMAFASKPELNRQNRFCTRPDAEAGHAAMIAELTAEAVFRP